MLLKYSLGLMVLGGSSKVKKKSLLKEISEISKKHKTINQKTGGFFNIFQILNVDTDEVRICRFIYELLNPEGSHYQGTIYLELFMENVLNITLDKDEYKSIKVYREYVIDNGRRIDLVIKAQKKTIPIEVKIYAGDQQDQCFDYYKVARKSKLYYLTLDGHSPEEHSVKGLTRINDTYKEIINISFEKEIMLWLKKCLENMNTIKIAPIREVILQMISNIKNLTDDRRDEEQMEIKDRLLLSRENLESAIEIENALPLARTELMLELFNNIYKEMLEKGKEVLVYDKGAIKEYYKPGKATKPELTIKIEDLNDDLISAICIKIDYRLYFAYSLMYYEKSQGSYKHKEISDIKEKNSNEYQGFLSATRNTSKWEYIYDNNEKRYNFKSFSQPCIELLGNTATVAKEICETIIRNMDEIDKLSKEMRCI